MTITINLMLVLWVVLAYAAVGIILFVPLILWSNRFVSGRSKVWAHLTFKHIIYALIQSAALWPAILFVCIQTEIRYRRKGYL